jgi:predicted nucleotidyltransferase
MGMGSSTEMKEYIDLKFGDLNEHIRTNRENTSSMESDVKKLQKELKNMPNTIQKALDKHTPAAGSNSMGGNMPVDQS